MCTQIYLQQRINVTQDLVELYEYVSKSFDKEKNCFFSYLFRSLFLILKLNDIVEHKKYVYSCDMFRDQITIFMFCAKKYYFIEILYKIH